MPPVDALYHFILLPVDTAFKTELAPAQIVAGVAVADEGTEGMAETVTVAVTLLVHPLVTV